MFQAIPAMPTWEVILLVVVPMIGSVSAAVGTFMNRKAIQEVHLSINSRMDQLLKSSVGEAQANAKAAGIKEGHLAGSAEGKILGIAEGKAASPAPTRIVGTIEGKIVKEKE